jgi:uncharacterized protein
VVQSVRRTRRAEGQNSLGFSYFKGKGVRRDYFQAAELYRKAAEQGHALAQANRGSLFKHCAGVPLDYVEAH